MPVAYLDLADVFSQSAALEIQAPDDFTINHATPASFARTEWAAIACARTDGLATLRASRPSRLRQWLLGRPRTYALASGRLEVLRRIAVEAWHLPQAISLPTLGAFIAAGYSNAQLRLLLSTTGALTVMATSR